MAEKLPTPFDGYQVDARYKLDYRAWNAVLGDVHKRLQPLENARDRDDALINTGVADVLRRIDGIIAPLILAAQSDIAEVRASADQVATSIAASLLQFEEQTTAALAQLDQATAAKLAAVDALVSAALASLNNSLEALQAQVDTILNGGILAGNVSETDERVFVSPTQKTDLAGLSTSLATATTGRYARIKADKTLEFVALPAATATAQGIVELATNAEAVAGTDTARAVTPAGVAAAIAALGDLFDVYVDEFAVSGTWTKRTGAVLVFAELLGGGQGGGAGNQSGSGPNLLGGTSGAGGDAVSYLFLAADLPATAPVSVGAGGVGSVSIQQSTTVPASPTPGGDTLFGSPILLRARGGANGNSGSLTGYDGVSPSLGGNPGNGARIAGTNASSTAGASSYRGGGGGGGGGVGDGTMSKGGAGGSPNLDPSTLGGGGLGGATDQPGGNGGDRQGGGGGGGATGTGTTTAGRGGDGGRGAGGGGGGAGRNASTSSTRYFGSGGNGGPGYARITTLVQRVN